MSDFYRRTLVSEMETAIWPWNSVDSVEEEASGSICLVMKSDLDRADKQREIDKCLSCTRQFCTNCLSDYEKEDKPKLVMIKQIEGQMIMEM